MSQAEQLQTTQCGLTLHKVDEVQNDDSITNDDGTKIFIPPVTCICHEVNECKNKMPTTPAPSTVSTQSTTTTTGPADQELAEMRNDANRFRGQFDKNSFSILSQITNDEAAISTQLLCNGVRVDFEYILTRVECCEGHVQIIKGLNLKICMENHDPVHTPVRAVVHAPVHALFKSLDYPSHGISAFSGILVRLF